MRLTLAVLLAVAALGFPAGPANAHHGFDATYDSNKPLVLHGVITKVELINPHSWFWIEVKNPDGTTVTWGMEGGSPNSLIRHGVTKDTLPVGTELIINGYQVKSGENKGVAATMTFPDGRKLFLGGSAPGAEGDTPGSQKPAPAPPNAPKKSSRLWTHPIYC